MISIVIPVYRKEEMFVKNLQQNWQFFEGCEIIVVNDYPKESIKKYMSGFDVVLIENVKNLGFGGAVNVGVNKTKSSQVVLFNSDVVLNNDAFKKAATEFKNDPELFAVSFAQKEKDNAIVGKNILLWSKGFVIHQKAKNLTFGINAWAEGGACMIDREKFQKLGGFDQIYSPFYWEDIDLSYRAWRSGYKVIYDPKIIVQHHHESTIGSYFSKKTITTISYRNQFIFTWKNITDWKLLISHYLLLLPNLLYHLIKRDFVFLKGLIQALVKIPQINEKGALQKKTFVKSDDQIFKLFR